MNHITANRFGRRWAPHRRVPLSVKRSHGVDDTPRWLGRSRRPSAFTLVELMVALTIALVLTAVALPRVKEGLKQNVATRTATMVKATFENARAQAIRTGRPFGVVLHRSRNEVVPVQTSDPNDLVQPVNLTHPSSLTDPVFSSSHGANYCQRMSFVQMAFEYRGDLEGAGAMFSLEGVRPSIICLQSQAGLLTAIARGNILPKDRPIVPGSVVSLGDLHDGFVVAIPPGRNSAIEIYSPLPSTNETGDLNGDGAVNAADAGVRVWLDNRAPITPALPRLTTGSVTTFRFSTAPIPSPMEDVPLPGKAVIDLNCSGFGPSVAAFSPRVISADGASRVFDRPYALNSTNANPRYAYRDIIIMFNGSGQLDSIYMDRYVANSGPDSSTESDDYVYTRIPIASPISILLADVRGVVPVETMSVWPERPTVITTMVVPREYEPTSNVTPNFANADNAWLTVSPLSGRVDLSPVANPLKLTDLTARHPDLIPNRVDGYVQARLFDSRRLARGTVK